MTCHSPTFRFTRTTGDGAPKLCEAFTPNPVAAAPTWPSEHDGRCLLPTDRGYVRRCDDAKRRQQLGKRRSKATEAAANTRARWIADAKCRAVHDIRRTPSEPGNPCKHGFQPHRGTRRRAPTSAATIRPGTQMTRSRRDLTQAPRRCGTVVLGLPPWCGLVAAMARCVCWIQRQRRR